jgi:hypothetical protein
VEYCLNNTGKGELQYVEKTRPSVLNAQQIPHGQQYMSVLCKLSRYVIPILTSLNLINKLHDKSSM